MIEERDDLQFAISRVRFVRQTSVARWATEVPEQSDDENGSEPDSPEHDVPRIIPVHEYFTGGTFQHGDDERIEEEDNDIGAPTRGIIESTCNEQGYITLREHFESETLTQRERFAYDGKMRLVRKVTEDPINEHIETEERFYNADGKIENKVITYSDGSQMVTKHLWNGNEEEEFTRSDEGIEGHKRRRYDSEGRLIERMETDPETNEATGEFTTYDAKGEHVEAGVIEADGSRWVSERTTRNADGTEDTTLTFDAEGNEIERKVSAYTFDDSHRIIRESITGPGSYWEGIYEYNDRGLISVSATRSMQDRRYQRGDRITNDTRTTWWEYEFYE